MKMSLVAIVLASVSLAAGQTTATPPAQTASPTPQTASPTPPTASPAPQGATPQPQKKEIKDPAEYNAYVSAVQQADPNAKISGLEAFLKQYPSSVMKEDAFELLMVTYQKSGNAAQVTATANRLLQVNPTNVRALAVLAYTSRASQNWADGRKYGEQGLQALTTMQKPDGVSDADFQQQKGQLSGLLNSVAGFSALQTKDYAAAQKYLRASVEANPNNLEDVYPLALAYLTAAPPDSLNGLFFIARAANLATGAGQTQIQNYGKSVYTKYHGSDQGWDDVLATAKANPLPPATFAVQQYIPPTPAQQAADLVKSKDPKDMSFAEWELVLSAGAQEDSDKVWNAIKDKSLQLEGTVITASADKVEIAASQDDIDAKRADIVLTMGGPIPARQIPKEGSTFDFGGTPVTFAPSPFVMNMEKGALLTTKSTTPTHKAPVHKRAAAPK